MSLPESAPPLSTALFLDDDAGGEEGGPQERRRGPASIQEAAMARLRDQTLSPVLRDGKRRIPPSCSLVTLEGKKRTPDAFIRRVRGLYPDQDHQKLFEKVEDMFHGPQSFSTRAITLYNQDGSQFMTVSATVSTTVQEILDLVAEITHLDARNLRVMVKRGPYWREENPFNEVSSNVRVFGVEQFARAPHRFGSTVVIVGAGLGGISQAVEMLRFGHEDFAILERLHDFGGASWMRVAGGQAKLQTELGTYHVNYPYPEMRCPAHLPAWPSRDQLLELFQSEARAYSLDEKTLFGTEVRGVDSDGNTSALHRVFKLHHAPTGGGSEASTFHAGAVAAWPGTHGPPVEVELPGEASFGGYIEYGYGGMCDFAEVEGKKTVLYGHGAFTVENVRTLVEHQAQKISIVCRRRNLVAPRMLSWLMNQSLTPVTGAQVLRVADVMYKLVGWDPWNCHSVECTEDRTAADIMQETLFCVSDLYFLALHYGKAEMHIDEIKRLTLNTAHLKKYKKISCQVILKFCGVQPDFSVDEALGMRHLEGFWVNGDPFRPSVSSGHGVDTRHNLTTLSAGHRVALNVAVVHHFLFYPWDLEACKEHLPRRTADGRPCHALPCDFAARVRAAVGEHCGTLGMKLSDLERVKRDKQSDAHPLGDFLGECRAEWDAYAEAFAQEFRKPPPPYPYTAEGMRAFQDLLRRDDAPRG